MSQEQLLVSGESAPACLLRDADAHRLGQTGQVLPLIAILLLTLIIAVSLTINGAAIHREHMQAQGAADAAALTTAQWDARALNTVSSVNVISALLGSASMLVHGNAYATSRVYLRARELYSHWYRKIPKWMKKEVKRLRKLRNLTRNLSADSAQYFQPLQQQLLTASQGSQRALHEAAMNAGREGVLLSRYDLTSLQVYGPTISNALPLTSSNDPTLLLSAVRYGRAGGFDLNQALSAAQASSTPQQAVNGVQTVAGQLMRSQSGPAFHENVSGYGELWIPVRNFLNVRVRSAGLYTWRNGGKGRAERGPYRFTQGKEAVNALSGWKSPLQFSGNGTGDLFYLGIARKHPNDGLPFAFRELYPSYVSRGPYAVGQAHVYNPYHPSGVTADLFTPQWRVQLEPINQNYVCGLAAVDAELAGLCRLLYH